MDEEVALYLPLEYRNSQRLYSPESIMIKSDNISLIDFPTLSLCIGVH